MLKDIGIQAYSAMRHNRRRSMLTMLGMAWGIATVVLLLAYGSGFERGLMAAFTTFGGETTPLAGSSSLVGDGSATSRFALGAGSTMGSQESPV